MIFNFHYHVTFQLEHFGIWSLVKSPWNYLREAERKERKRNVHSRGWWILEHIKSFSLSSISVQCIVLPSSYAMWTIVNYFMVKNIVIHCATISKSLMLIYGHRQTFACCALETMCLIYYRNIYTWITHCTIIL